MSSNISFLSLRSLRVPVMVVIWAVVAVLLRPVAPWVFWLTMIALPAYVILWEERSYLASLPGKRVLLLSLVLFLCHIIWAIVRTQYYDASQFGTYWKDDHAYYNEAAAIAKAWKSGFYPEIWLYGSLPYLGTLHTGYHRPLAAVFMLFGPSTAAGLVLNAFCAGCLPLLTALAGRYLWMRDLAQPVQTPLSDIGLLAAVLAALHPTQFYWSGFLMKDLYLTFVFLASMVLVLGTFRRRSIAMGTAALLMVPYLFTVRAYTAIALAIGAIMLPVTRISRQISLKLGTATVLIMVVLCAYTEKGNKFYSQLKDSLYPLIPRNLDSPTELLTQIGAGIPRLFLSPYAWLIVDGPSGMYGMYPGMWYLYLVGYPLGFAGLYAAVKRDIHPAIVPLAVFGLTSLIFLTAVYQGDASRQRYHLEYIVLLFAAFGLQNRSRWWIGGILAAEAAFAIGQVLTLR